MSEGPQLTTVELAARWQVSRGHLSNLRSAGCEPNYIKIGTAVRYRLSDIEAFEEANTVRAGGWR